MGFIDAIKRWRLSQKGMSSGKKRRTQREHTVAGSLNRNITIRLILYIAFIAFSSILVYHESQAGFSNFFNYSSSMLVLLNVMMCIGLILLFELLHHFKLKNSHLLLVYSSLLAQLLLNYLVIMFVDGSSLKVLCMSYILSPMIATVLLGRGAGLFAVTASVLLGMFLSPKPYEFAVIGLMSGVVVVFMTLSVRRRSSLLRAGLYSGLVVFLLGIVFSLIELHSSNSSELGEVLIKLVCSFGVSLMIAMSVSGMLPLLEGLFSLTTTMTWIELSDLNNKLLRRLQLEASGTFHHSLVVANLSEAAAESIGANAAMCRACSYFHDIGKLKKPEYFIENQGDTNPHDSLTPTMSALIILSHVKEGVDMAIKHKLNNKIIDIIKEHHGDSLVYYFYKKAVEQAKSENEKVAQGLEKEEDVSEVSEKSFRYSGPRPRSKESGIISLADAIESASRSLKKPTTNKIESMIEDIVNKRLLEGQLDNCGLTLRELSQVKESFLKTLRSIMHSRIDYPKDIEHEEKMKSLDSLEKNHANLKPETKAVETTTNTPA